MVGRVAIRVEEQDMDCWGVDGSGREHAVVVEAEARFGA